MIIIFRRGVEFGTIFGDGIELDWSALANADNSGS
jgi:hypothetical protein